MNNKEHPIGLARDYNDTISSYIATVCLDANEIYRKEILYCTQEVAIARAISDSLKKHLEIVEIDYSIDRDEINHCAHDESWWGHIYKSTFMKLADILYESKMWRCDKRGYPFTERFRFSVAVLKLERIKDER